MQYVLIAIILYVAWRGLRTSQQQTAFKTREADRTDLKNFKNSDHDLASAKMHKRQPSSPLSLPGIRLSGEAHEILGIDANARPTEIMRAYKEKIKLFHPDRIQGQAREQLKFYEEASAKINQAKEEMLAHFKK